MGDRVDTAVFYRLVFGFEDLAVVDLEVQLYLGDIDGDSLELVFGDDVFFGHRRDF